jgi:hydrogenase nickel incorporation protein HypA/HybF
LLTGRPGPGVPGRAGPAGRSGSDRRLGRSGGWHDELEERRVHELAIVESVVCAVCERLPGARVTCVRLEIGALSGVVADSVRFCFGLATEGTNLEGASLEIIEPAAWCRCRTCGSDFEPDWPIVLCPCGSADAQVVSGEELKIISVQVA